jgi:hypothetical protein
MASTQKKEFEHIGDNGMSIGGVQTIVLNEAGVQTRMLVS